MGTDKTTVETEDRSPFQAESEYDATAADVYEELLDNWVISPLKVLWSDYRGRFGLIVAVLYLLMGTVGVIVVPEPYVGQGPRLQMAFQSMEHPLGTNTQGHDLLGLMVHSTPAMLKMMLAGAIFGNSMGIIIGLLSGYKGGNLDKILMTLTDTIGSIPGLPLLLILVAIIEPSNPFLIGVVVSIQDWAGGARGIRSQVLPLRKKEYVEAARSMGQSTSSVLIKQILPELLPMITIGFLGGMTGIISSTVGLYFLGILPYTQMNWGVVLSNAYRRSGALYSWEAVHWLMVPMVTISLLSFGLTLLAQAFDQVFNPRVRARHEARKRNDEDAEPGEGETDTTDISSQMGMH